MSDASRATSQISPEAASAAEYDVVIVGSGVAGSILAKELSQSGFRVLVMEAGSGRDITVRDYEKNLERFYSEVSKDNNAPYPKSRNAPMPRSYETQKLRPGAPETSGYFVQNGPWEIDSTYTRVLGGTTRHWEGKALRMLPDDFSLRTRFGHGLDWPLAYEDLNPYYRKAELELGVSGDVEDQMYGGLDFGPGYVYPMHRMPPSYLDQMIAKDLDGTEATLDDETFTLRVRSTPQARNGIPNPAYDDGKGHRPTGAVSIHQAEMGERCQGNTNCVPICPVQAKYDARRTLFRALETGRVDLLPQAVASKVHVDAGSGRVTAIEYKSYRDADSPEHTTGRVRGKVFVLAANAVENARLMLASSLHGSSGLMGRNLMDHAYLLTWALMPEVAGSFRGPLCTSGIEDLRTGAFRRRQAAFRVGIHNDGWGWATASPYTDLDTIIDRQNKFGAELRRELVSRLSRQVLIDYMVEMLPDESNRVTVDPQYVDQLGNPRPVISFGIRDYTLEGIAFGRRLSRRIYQRLGAEDYTSYDPAAVGYMSYQGEAYVIRGGNHWAGTHLMGTSAKNSVVDSRQRSWDHENLYLAGAGSMPSIGTANTTLTLSALCFQTAEQIATDLRAASAPIKVRKSGSAA
ncbi:MAG TPA: GMC family oxidoreductase [Thermoanaerobaculia bacterium]|nr:GMC family oxidoreductase [Thermoanaerobaculia bacterium]